MMIPIAYNVRSLMVRKATSSAAVVGLGLVVLVFAAVLMLSSGIRDTLGRGARPDIALVLGKGADSELMSDLGVADQSLILGSSDVAKRSDGQPDGLGELLVLVLLDKIGTAGFANVQVRGISDDAFVHRPQIKIVEGRAPRPGTDEAVVGRAIRGRFSGLALEQTLLLRKNRPVKVVGVFEDGGSSYESEVWTSIDTLRATFGRQGLISSVRVRLANAGLFDEFRGRIERDPKLGFKVLRESDYYASQSEGGEKLIMVLGTLVAVFFAIGATLGAAVTMYGAISNRQREIGTLRALGFSRRSIVASFLLESVLLALAGGTLGVAGALALGMVSFSMTNPSSFSEIVFGFHPTAEIVVGALMFAACMGVLGGLFPAVRAARLSPTSAMRGD
jgi:putative ABC transport system permease protein